MPNAGNCVCNAILLHVQYSESGTLVFQHSPIFHSAFHLLQFPLSDNTLSTKQQGSIMLLLQHGSYMYGYELCSPLFGFQFNWEESREWSCNRQCLHGYHHCATQKGLDTQKCNVCTQPPYKTKKYHVENIMYYVTHEETPCTLCTMFIIMKMTGPLGYSRPHIVYCDDSSFLYNFQSRWTALHTPTSLKLRYISPPNTPTVTAYSSSLVTDWRDLGT